MSDSQHDLASEFPEHKSRIHDLKTSDRHFRNLFDQYHDLNKAIHRSETRVDLLTDIEEEKLRKQRLKLKDELLTILQKQ